MSVTSNSDHDTAPVPRGPVDAGTTAPAEPRIDAIGLLPPELFRALHEHSSDIVSILEPDGAWRFTSPSGTRLLGWPPGYDPGPLGIFGFVHPDDLAQAQEMFADVKAGRRDPDAAVVLRAKSTDGAWRQLETRARDLTHDPNVRGIVVTCRDVTDRVEAEARIRLLHGVLEASTELVLVCDLDARVVYCNQQARRLLDASPEETTLPDLERIVLGDWPAIIAEIAAAVDGGPGTWSGELTVRTPEGDELPLVAAIQRHHDAQGSDEFISVIAHDIRELKSTQARLEHQATHDALTGLPNRALLQELGDQAVARSNRYGTTVAVLFLDLDRFKPVNDSLGHAAGDELLVQVACRLRTTVRRGDVVARFGGDEFVVLCEHPAGQTEISELARRCIETLSEPMTVMGREVTLGASVGIAVGGGGRVTVDALIRDADAALYRAKELGRGRAVLFGDPDANGQRGYSSSQSAERSSR